MMIVIITKPQKVETKPLKKKREGQTAARPQQKARGDKNDAGEKTPRATIKAQQYRGWEFNLRKVSNK